MAGADKTSGRKQTGHDQDGIRRRLDTLGERLAEIHGIDPSLRCTRRGAASQAVRRRSSWSRACASGVHRLGVGRFWRRAFLWRVPSWRRRRIMNVFTAQNMQAKTPPAGKDLPATWTTMISVSRSNYTRRRGRAGVRRRGAGDMPNPVPVQDQAPHPRAVQRRRPVHQFHLCSR
jgi:hypothetical protein